MTQTEMQTEARSETETRSESAPDPATKKIAITGAISALVIGVICVIVALFAVGAAIDIWFQYQWSPIFTALFFGLVGVGGIGSTVWLLKRYV